MSTANKLTYLNTTKQKLKQAINNIGGEITDETTFREYVQELQDIYDNLPKTSYAEGTEITLSNTLKGKLDFEDGIVGYGDTKQNSYEGYNELNIYVLHPKGYTETISGVTFKYNDDGSVTANGKATADINYFLGSRATLGDIFNGTYYLSGCMNGSNSTYFLSMWADGIGVYPQTTTEVATNKTSGVNWNIVIAVKSGASVNYTFYPMMSKTSGKSFEPYVGNSPSPSPSYPQEIEVVRGKNRFDGELLPNSYNPTTGEIEASGTSYRSNKIPLQKNETYYLSGITGNVRVLYWNNTSYVSSEVITMPNSFITKGNIIAFQFDKSLSHENIMIEKGSQATSYLPYNTIEVVERGKNYFHLASETYTKQYGVSGVYSNSKIKINGTTTNGTNILNTNVTSIGTYKAGTYTFSTKILSGNITLNGGACAIYIRNSSTQTSETVLAQGGFNNELSNKEFTLTQNTELFLQIYCNASNVVFNNYEVGIQIEEGSSSTSFEEYITPKTYQLSLGEYEFNGIDNYKDELVYDVDEDKVYKNEKIEKRLAVITGGNLESHGFRASTDGTEVAPISAYPELLCNFFKSASDYSQSVNADWLNPNKLGINVTGGILCNISNFSTLVEYTDFFSNNDVYIYYPKSTSTLIEITDTTLKTQVKALYNSHSFTGTTIIEIDGQLPLIIKVRALKGE